MILITLVKKDGKDGESFPFEGNDVEAATEKFIEFCTAHPFITMRSKTAKIRRVVEMDEVAEITLPEANTTDLLQDALRVMKVGEDLRK